MLQDPRESRLASSWAQTKAREEFTPALLPLVESGLQPCELRWERPIEGDGSRAGEIVCMAMGGKRLAVKGEDPSEMLATCGSCTIPTESARRPCLYLVPFKTEREGQPRDYFACRWFYKLKPEDPATTTRWMCGGCPYWFPRPPVEFFRDLEGITQEMIQYHQDAWAGRLPPSPFAKWFAMRTPPPSGWRRLLDCIMRHIW